MRDSRKQSSTAARLKPPAKMQSHAIAVVDTGGHLVAALRMDGTGSGMMDFALAKAEAVAAWGFSTADMAAGAKDTPGLRLRAARRHRRRRSPDLQRRRQDRLGAAGASGEAPEDDAACVTAGITAAGLRSSRS